MGGLLWCSAVAVAGPGPPDLARVGLGEILWAPDGAVAAWTGHLVRPPAQTESVLFMAFGAGAAHGIDLEPLVPPVGASEVWLGLETSWIVTTVGPDAWDALWEWWRTRPPAPAAPGVWKGPSHGVDPGWRRTAPADWSAPAARLALVARPSPPPPPVVPPAPGEGERLTREFLQRIPSSRTEPQAPQVLPCRDAPAEPRDAPASAWRTWTLPGGRVGLGQALWVAAAFRHEAACVVDAGATATLLACPADAVGTPLRPVDRVCVHDALVARGGLAPPVSNTVLFSVAALSAGGEGAPSLGSFFELIGPPAVLPPAVVVPGAEAAVGR